MLVTDHTAELPWMHPGACAILRLDGKDIGWCGALHPAVLKQFDVKGVPTIVFLDAHGRERDDMRLVDFMPPDQFLIGESGNVQFSGYILGEYDGRGHGGSLSAPDVRRRCHRRC